MKTLIPIVDAIVRSRKRIEIDPDKIDGWFKGSYTTSMHVRRTRQIRIWVDEFTTGRFYLSRGTVAFEDEKDFIIFKLWYKDNENTRS